MNGLQTLAIFSRRVPFFACRLGTTTSAEKESGFGRNLHSKFISLEDTEFWRETVKRDTKNTYSRIKTKKTEMLTRSSRLPDQGLENEASNSWDPTNGGTQNDSTSLKPEDFKPRKVLILTKLTRLEFEQRTNPHLDQGQLGKKLKHRGSDVGHLLERHNMHKSYLRTVVSELEARGIEQRLCQRWEFTDELVSWADAIFTAGGDGTFLLAASKVRDTSIPVIGINTDPVSSEGYLCLQKKLPESHFHKALDRLLSGDFKWLWRQRIRITITGKNQDDPVELHDQQLIHPEHRWSEHIREEEDSRLLAQGRRKTARPSPNISPSGEPGGAGVGIDRYGPSSSLLANSEFANNRIQNSARGLASIATQTGSMKVPTSRSNSPDKVRLLPFFALNDVFIGESLSSRVSYYELQVDDGAKTKQKSSGLTVCTGTGSTSWYFNINKMTEHGITDLLKLVKEETGLEVPAENQEIVSRICKKFNEKLIFSPSDTRMAYAVRDPVYNSTFDPFPPRGFANKVHVKSRCFDAHLVVDGGMSYMFNDGSKALLEVDPKDSLRTVVFRDEETK